MKTKTGLKAGQSGPNTVELTLNIAQNSGTEGSAAAGGGGGGGGMGG